MNMPASRETGVADLSWRIERKHSGESAFFLEHRLASPSKRLALEEIVARTSLRHAGDLSRLETDLYETLEAILRRLSPIGEPLTSHELMAEIEALGSDISDRLVPQRILHLFADHWDDIETLHVVSEDIEIPWELVRAGPEERLDFLCRRFAMTRWVPGDLSAADRITVESILGLRASGGPALPALSASQAEIALLEDLAATRPAITVTVLDPAESEPALEHLRTQQWDIVHVTCHGDVDPKNGDRSSLILKDRAITARELSQEKLSWVRTRRPFVFLNACRTGRRGRALTGVGGWPDRWARRLRCGALLCPQWAVSNSRAARFAQDVYQRLEADQFLAFAVRDARRALLEEEPSDPTPLAYSLYAHPGTRVELGAASGETRSPPPLARVSSVWTEQLRRLSELSAQDAELVTPSEVAGSRRDIRLDNHLYVERTIEPNLREKLVAEETTALLVVGQAGCGKTSLLWSLYRWLRRSHPNLEAWLLNASRMGSSPRRTDTYPSGSELLGAVRQCVEHGHPPILMIDTADVQLHDSSQRESFCILLLSCLDLGARVITTCRPQESGRLPRAARGNKPIELDTYDPTELEKAIWTHVESYYAYSQPSETQRDAELIHAAAARGQSLKEVCENPLTLRMLFELYAPDRIHELEINTCRLYAQFWTQRVRTDRRPGSVNPGPAADLSRTAAALALVLLAEGRPELGAEGALGKLSAFGGDPGQIEDLLSRGVIRRSAHHHLRFFHQTFFEHAAARGLVGWDDGRGLEWAFEKIRRDSGDAFLAPIVQEMLILGENLGAASHASSDRMTESLLADRRPNLFRLGLYVYAHRLHPTPAHQRETRRLLVATTETQGKTPTAVKAWLDTAPNTEEHRLDQVLEEADLLWQRGGTLTRQRLIALLGRLAYRKPEAVIELVERWRAVDWLRQVPASYDAQRELIELGAALLESRPSWSWDFSRELYGQLLASRGYLEDHARIAIALAGGPLLDDGLGPATRFEQTFRHRKMGPRANVELAEGHGNLWTRQWTDQTTSVPAIVEDILSSASGLPDLFLYARFSALAARLRSETPEIILRACDDFLEAGDLGLLSKWLHLVVRPAISEEGEAGETFRRGWRAALGNPSLDEVPPTLRMLVNCLRESTVSSEQLPRLLDGLTIDFEVWLHTDRFLPVLGRGLMAGIASAERAVAAVLEAPHRLSQRDLTAVAAQLAATRDLRRGLRPALELALALADVELLFKLAREVEAGSSRIFDAATLEKAHSLILPKSRHAQNPLMRRAAIQAWRELVRLGHLSPPSPETASQALASEADKRCRIAWFHLLAEAPAAPQVDPLAALLQELVRSEGDPAVADHARSSLVSVIGEAKDPAKWIDVAIEAAVQPTVGLDRIARLTKALSRLCDLAEASSGSPDRPEADDFASRALQQVFEAIDRIFDASRQTSRNVAREVGNKLKGLLSKAFRTADEGQFRFLIERCRTDPFELSMAPIAAIYAQPDPRLRELLDPLLEDPSVPEDTRDLIARHKHYSERPEGSRGYPELYRLASGADAGKVSDHSRSPGQSPSPTQRHRAGGPTGGDTRPEDAEPAPVDLLWRIESEPVPGGMVFRHTFSFPSKNVRVPGFDSRSERVHEDDLRRLESRLFADLEAALRKKTPAGDPADPTEIQGIVRRLGNRLAERLVPQQAKDLFGLQGDAIRSVLLVTDDPGIPWELARLATGDSGTDFLGCSTDLARWSTKQEAQPKGLLRIGRALGLMAGDVGIRQSLGSAPQERQMLEQLFKQYPAIDSKLVEPAATSDLTDRLTHLPPDLLHFFGHGDYHGEDPDRSSLIFADRSLEAHELDEERLRTTAEVRPLVVLNACRTGRGGPALTGVGGWPDRWVRIGRCGALLCPQWAVRDGLATRFAESFYRRLSRDPETTLGQAVRETRQELLDQASDDPTPLAYALYGHPNARVTLGRGPRSRSGSSGVVPSRNATTPGRPLHLPEPEWQPDRSPPGALLRAEYGVVKFHFRERDLADLTAWSQADPRVGVRLFTGPGGIGKTRLAKELCLRLREQGWLVGFVDEHQAPEQVCQAMTSHSRPSLAVIDYAESRSELIVPVLRRLLAAERGRYRIVLLARAALGWWDQLQGAGDSVGELLMSPRATRRISLRPLAPSLDQRRLSFGYALDAFADILGRERPPNIPDDLDAELYDRVLMIHMRALAATRGEDADDEDRILDFALARERRHWKRLLAARGLPPTLLPAVSRSACALYLVGGAGSETEALELIRQLSVFGGQTDDVILAIVHLLHDDYPGSVSGRGRWIEPLMPDLLGEHLVERELEQGAKEILDVALGSGKAGAFAGTSTDRPAAARTPPPGQKPEDD